MKVGCPFSTDEKTAVEMVNRALEIRGRPVGVSPVDDANPKHEFVVNTPDESHEAVRNAFRVGGNMSGVGLVIR